MRDAVGLQALWVVKDVESNTVKRRIGMRALVSSIALLALCFSVFAQEIQPRVIRFGYGLDEQSNQGRAVQFFAEQVAKNSGGKLRLRAIGAAALGPDVQMQQALIRGSQEMMVGSTATLVGISQEMALWDTPFLLTSAAEADAILDGPIGRKIMDRLQEKGLVGLVYWENGFRNLTTDTRPVRQLEDFDGLKLRVMQNEIYLKSFNLLGANATPLPFSELFPALESKLVDGQENPFNTILSSRFFEVQKYLSITNHVYSPWVMLASKKWWDQLSANEQKVLRDAAVASRDHERAYSRKESVKAVAMLKDKGMLVNELPAREIERMRERLCSIHLLIANNVGKEIWQETQAALGQLRGRKSGNGNIARLAASSGRRPTDSPGGVPCR